MSFIKENLYKEIIKNVPILCIDLIIIYHNRYLLVKRNDNPLKDEWWVPGGRVYIGESLEDAAKRKLIEELNLPVEDTFKLAGFYEDIFEESSFGPHLYQTMSVVFSMILKELPSINLDLTSSDWEFKTQLPIRFSNKLRRL